MTGAPFDLSICADMVFVDLPFLERLRRISSAGFGVEFWQWRDRDIHAIARDKDVRVAGCNGYVSGSMVHPDGASAYLSGVRESVAVAQTLGLRHLFLTTGEMGPGGRVAHAVERHPARRALTAYRVLNEIAEIAERYDLTYSLENLNAKVDHAGYALPLVEDVLVLVEAVGSPRIRILLDLYHAQVEEGNLVEIVRHAAPHIGHVQVADVPGRHEPGTGEVNYPAIGAALRGIGYAGGIGLEATPSGTPQQALERFRAAFAT